MLESSVAIWSPNLVKDIKSIENVQRRATKLIPKIKNYSYEERLKVLNLPSLEYRRKRGDMILTFKILKGFLDTDSSLIFDIAQSNTRGHVLKLFKKRCSSNLRKMFFSQRIINDWNKLPGEVVNCSTVIEFEKKYDKNETVQRFVFK